MDVISLVMLIIVLVFMFFLCLGSIPIRIWDEARLANSALYMHLHGFSIIPFYDDQPDMWSTKPPLMIWLQVFSIKLFGVNEWAVRFPAALSSILTGIMLWQFGRRHFQNTWMGFLSGCILATTYAYVNFHAGRTGDYDALLSLLVTGSCLCFFLYCTSGATKYIYGFGSV